MAWLYLRGGSFADVLPKVRLGIQRYTDSRQKSKGYHETITRAYLVLIADRMRTDRAGSFAEFRSRNPDLADGQLRALRPHYRQETLLGDRAREHFVPPDLAPLPCLEPAADVA
jgi:hypothetical protein